MQSAFVLGAKKKSVFFFSLPTSFFLFKGPHSGSPPKNSSFGAPRDPRDPPLLLFSIGIRSFTVFLLQKESIQKVILPPSSSTSAAEAAAPLFCPFFSFSSASSFGALRIWSRPPAPWAAPAAADSFLAMMSLVTSCFWGFVSGGQRGKR